VRATARCVSPRPGTSDVADRCLASLLMVRSASDCGRRGVAGKSFDGEALIIDDTETVALHRSGCRASVPAPSSVCRSAPVTGPSA
jgi:hypothetical protein